LALLIETGLPAVAGGGFELVIPGRPGVPIVINGIDASYAVVEGDWGLSKGVHVQPRSMAAARSIPSRGSVITTRLRVDCRVTAASKSNRPPTAFCRNLRRAFTNPGRRNRPPQPVQPEVPFYPPPVILAPQAGQAGTAQEPEFRPQ